MDDFITSRARLARNNINILGAAEDRIVYEFQYRLPTTRQTVWRKTISEPLGEDWAYQILDEVRALRRELEHGETRAAD